MIGHLPRLAPGDRISADAYNRLVAEIERLSNLTASPPLSMRQEGSGYHLRMDPPASSGGGGGSLEVKATSGSPDYTGITTLEFPDLEFALTNPSSPVVQVARRFSGASYKLTGTQAIPSAAPLAFNAVSWPLAGQLYDTDGYITVFPNTAVTIPQTGYYLCVFTAYWDINNTGDRMAAISATVPNPAAAVVQPAASNGLNNATVQTVAQIIKVATSNGVSFGAGQNSGGNLNLTGSGVNILGDTFFTITYLGE